MSLMNLKGLMKQKVLDPAQAPGVGAKAAPGATSWMSAPKMSTAIAAPATPKASMFPKKRAISDEVKPMPNLFKRLTGK